MDSWNVNNVDCLEMEWMFYECESLEIVEIPNLKGAKFEKFPRKEMFVGCNENLNVIGTYLSLSLMFDSYPKLRFNSKEELKQVDDKASYSIKDNKDKTELDNKDFKKIV